MNPEVNNELDRMRKILSDKVYDFEERAAALRRALRVMELFRFAAHSFDVRNHQKIVLSVTAENSAELKQAILDIVRQENDTYGGGIAYHCRLLWRDLSMVIDGSWPVNPKIEWAVTGSLYDLVRECESESLGDE